MIFLKNSVCLCCCLLGVTMNLVSIRVAAQEVDTVPVVSHPPHSPRRASIYSAILPGAGQVYNKQYWKPPIIWGGLGVTAYYIGYNLKKFKEYKQGYVLATDSIQGNQLPQFEGKPADLLLRGVEFYRRNRDYSYFFFGLFYLLNILDAAVYAHLFYFDVNENISLNIQPYNNFSTQPAYGVRLVMNF